MPDPGRVPAYRLIPRFVAFDAALSWRRWRRRLGLLALGAVDEVALAPPDTALAAAALALARASSPAFLLNHAGRTWAFAATFAARDRAHVDREALFVASLLHDLGLTGALADEPGSFEWSGARAARDFCFSLGVTSARADLIHNAIALHAAVGAASRHSPEAALVQLGAGGDVLGPRLGEVPPPPLARTLDAWPRLGFKRAFSPLLERQARAKPRCHIAGHLALGFGPRIAAAPFAE